MARFSVDPKSYELAEHFLTEVEGATEEQKRDLAQQIQDVCEGFLGCSAETFAALTSDYDGSQFKQDLIRQRTAEYRSLHPRTP